MVCKAQKVEFGQAAAAAAVATSLIAGVSGRRQELETSQMGTRPVPRS